MASYTKAAQVNSARGRSAPLPFPQQLAPEDGQAVARPACAAESRAASLRGPGGTGALACLGESRRLTGQGRGEIYCRVISERIGPHAFVVFWPCVRVSRKRRVGGRETSRWVGDGFEKAKQNRCPKI